MKKIHIFAEFMGKYIKKYPFPYYSTYEGTKVFRGSISTSIPHPRCGNFAAHIKRDSPLIYVIERLKRLLTVCILIQFLNPTHCVNAWCRILEVYIISDPEIKLKCTAILLTISLLELGGAGGFSKKYFLGKFRPLFKVGDASWLAQKQKLGRDSIIFLLDRGLKARSWPIRYKNAYI